IDESGDVLVVDTYNGRVQQFTNGGAFVAAWGSEQFDGQPRAIAVDRRGNVFVVDDGTYRGQNILEFTSTGRFLTSWGASFSVGAAIDGSGRLLVVETPRCFAFPPICIGDNRIEVFTNTGLYLTTWGTSGAGDGQFAFSFSSGIAVEQRGRV